MFIDFLHHFVIDHINCYYFRHMTYSIGRKYHCDAKDYDSESQPLVCQDVYSFTLQKDATFQVI